MKSQSGFTIMEVLIAMFILISAIFVLSDLQMRAILRVVRDRDKIDRVFLVKKELYEALYDKKKHSKRTKTSIEDPEIIITTAPSSIEKKSDLKDLSTHIRVVQTKGRWKKNGKDNEIMMVSFIATPDEKEKK